MSLYAIARIIKDDELLGVRILDTDTNNHKDIPLTSLKHGLSSGVKVENLEVVNGELKGINGSIERYTTITAGGRLCGESSFVIINKLEDKGYTVVDYIGNVRNYRTEDILKLVTERGLKVANGKILKRDGKPVVSAIEGSYMVKSIVIPEDKMEETQRLVSHLNKARQAYEQEDREIMSNHEYDRMYDELERLENETGIKLRESPTQNVGYEVVSSLQKEKHEYKLLSLDKTKDISSLVAFLKDKVGVLSWKLDGLTVVVTYEGGKLVKAVTRGNGEVGELVTSNARQFFNLPLEVPFKEKLVIRGEAIISYSGFYKINNTIADESQKYKNPRNLCSGTVRQLNSRVTAERNVLFIAFNLLQSEGYTSKSVTESLKFIESLGIDVVQSFKVNGYNIEEKINMFKDLVEDFDYPSDGLVLTYDDIEYGKSLGVTSKFPRHSIAFKWGDEAAETRLVGIEWSPSRTGLINPIALFEPVELEGTTVSRASIHNVSIMRDLQLGLGDTITVYKANMIIPQVLDNLTRSDTCEIPDCCPSCGYETFIHEEVSGVETLYCDNELCGDKGIKLLTHFVARDAMNIDGLSDARLQRFVEEGFIETFADIYNLNEYEYDIINMEGFGQKSFDRLINAIEKSRSVRLANLIYALGIPNVGLATAKLIAKNCNYNLNELASLTVDSLLSIDGIGNIIAYSFVNWMENRDNAEMFVELLKEVNLVAEEVSNDTSLVGKVFCCTGKVYQFNNRTEIKELVESKGGRMTGSVTSNTSYLITNDTSSGSKKNKEAQKLGVEIITEQEFIDKFITG